MINTKLDTTISINDIKDAYIEFWVANIDTSKYEYIKNILSKGINIYLRLEDPAPETIEYLKSLKSKTDNKDGSIIQDSYVNCIRVGNTFTEQKSYCNLENPRVFRKISDKNTINKIVNIHNKILLSYVISIY